LPQIVGYQGTLAEHGGDSRKFRLLHSDRKLGDSCWQVVLEYVQAQDG